VDWESARRAHIDTLFRCAIRERITKLKTMPPSAEISRTITDLERLLLGALRNMMIDPVALTNAMKKVLEPKGISPHVAAKLAKSVLRKAQC
jgi:hypothetical protein